MLSIDTDTPVSPSGRAWEQFCGFVKCFPICQTPILRTQKSEMLPLVEERWALRIKILLILFKHQFLFPFGRAPESSGVCCVVFALPGTGSPDRDCTIYLLHTWLLSTTIHTSPIFNKIWALSSFSAYHIPQPHLATGFSQQRCWNNIGLLCYEKPSTTCDTELLQPPTVWVTSL